MILAIDPGGRRYGVAIADLETRFARPLEVVDSEAVDILERIKEIISEQGVTQIVVGRPVALSGVDGPAAESVMSFMVALRSAVDVGVDVYDERLTTVMAERRMRDAGLSAAKRKEVRDSVAAQVLLQSYLDSKR